MIWEDIIKRRDIKIPKRRKGNVDPSRFMMSKPAIRDDSEIKREQAKIRLQAIMTETYKNLMDAEIKAPNYAINRIYQDLGDLEFKFNRRLENATEDSDKEEYDKIVERLRAEDKSQMEKAKNDVLKYSRNLRNLIGLEGGSLDNNQHTKKLKTAVYNRFKNYFDNKPMRMNEEDYERLKPLVSKIKLTREQNAQLEYDLAEYKFDMLMTLKRLTEEMGREGRREVRDELDLYKEIVKHPRRSDYLKKSEDWQTVLKKRSVTRTILSRRMVDLGMPIHLAKEIINSLNTYEVSKYGRMIEIMKDETIKKAVDMYLEKRQEADKTPTTKESFSTTPENARAYSRYFLHLLETL